MRLSAMSSCRSRAKTVSGFTDNKPFSRALFHTFRKRGLFLSERSSLLTSRGRNVGHEAKMLHRKTKTLCFFFKHPS